MRMVNTTVRRMSFVISGYVQEIRRCGLIFNRVLNMVRDTLSGRAAAERGLFDRDYVNGLLDDPEAHMTPLRGSKLWQLGLLENWLQTHGI